MVKRKRKGTNKVRDVSRKILIAFLLFTIGYQAIREYPYVGVILAVVATIVFLMIRYNKRTLARKYSTIDELLEVYGDKPTDFEHYIANLYSLLGFRTKVTPAANDMGKDIEMWKDDNKYVVEVKLYSPHNKIGREKIQKLHSAMIDSDADRAIFITTSGYTSSAVDYAHKFGIELLDGHKTVDLINSVKNVMQSTDAIRE